MSYSEDLEIIATTIVDIDKRRFNCGWANVNTSDYFEINFGIIYCNATDFNIESSDEGYNCNYYRGLTKRLIEYNVWILVLDRDIHVVI